MGAVIVGRINQLTDPKVEAAIQEVATEVGNILQHGTGAPDANTQGKIYFQRGAPDANGWATVATIYINTNR